MVPWRRTTESGHAGLELFHRMDHVTSAWPSEGNRVQRLVDRSLVTQNLGDRRRSAPEGRIAEEHETVGDL